MPVIQRWIDAAQGYDVLSDDGRVTHFTADEIRKAHEIDAAEMHEAELFRFEHMNE